MSYQSIRQFVAALMLVTIGIIAIGRPATVQSSAIDQSVAAELVRQLNAVRHTEHLPPVLIDNRLQAAAQDKATAQLSQAALSHTLMDGRSPWTFVRASGYQYELAGENLALGFATPSAVTAAWLASPTHRSIMLDPAFTEVGIATAASEIIGRRSTVVVEFMARPAVISPIDLLLSLFTKSTTD